MTTAPNAVDEPGDLDWEAAEDSAAFAELTAKRGRAVLASLAVIVANLALFVLVMTYARSFGAEQVLAGVSVAYLVGLAQTVVGWLVIARFLRRSEREFDPAEERAAAAALRQTAR